LPKENVNFEYICYTITIDETAELNVTLFNNGSEISLTKGEGEDLSSGNNSFNGDVSIASEEEQVKEKTFMFKSNENLNQTANTTYVINSSSLDRFTKPSSLAKVLKEADWSTYLEETTLENGDTVLTYKKGNMYVLFETDAEFYLSEEIRYITK